MRFGDRDDGEPTLIRGNSGKTGQKACRLHISFGRSNGKQNVSSTRMIMQVYRNNNSFLLIHSHKNIQGVREDPGTRGRFYSFPIYPAVSCGRLSCNL